VAEAPSPLVAATTTEEQDASSRVMLLSVARVEKPVPVIVIYTAAHMQ
jgi:hypothetical protein